MWLDDPLLDDILEELDIPYCVPKQNQYGTWVTICNCKYGVHSH